ncbi:MAG: DinB family protein, partial [Rudaea sp.]
RRMVTGENPRLKPDYNNDYYNARQQEKRANLTVDQLRAELIETRADLLSFMESLRERDLLKQGQHPVAGDTTVIGVLRILQEHERGHIEILAALGT